MSAYAAKCSGARSSLCRVIDVLGAKQARHSAEPDTVLPQDQSRLCLPELCAQTNWFDPMSRNAARFSSSIASSIPSRHAWSQATSGGPLPVPTIADSITAQLSRQAMVWNRAGALYVI